HELLGSKRGTQAELALARLRRLRPGLRVWGLSATLGNLDVAMGTLLGPRHAGDGVLISAKTKTNYKIDTALPPEIDRFPWAGHLGTSMVDAVVGAVEEARTTIVFTNVRSAAELWYQAILKKRPDWAGLIAVHHGSLDGETRGWVEAGLKAGKLKCVVSTSSLDLGVDFSPVDRVLQVGSPKSVARLLQRAGRSGHRPGESSRVTGIPTNALELIEFAACRDALQAGFIESREPFENPTDVLVQHAVTVAVGGGFARDALLEEVRETRAFADLTAPEWDWVLDFVTRGGEALRAYEEYRRVVERDGSYVVEDRQIARRHKLAIGTITADEAVDVCYTTGGRIGQVEESFVSKLNPGDCFIFAGRVLEFVRVRDMKALVKKATKKTRIVPRWGGGRMPLSGTLSEAIRRKLDEARRDIYDGPEMRAVRPILETQAAFSRLPAVDELLIEKIKTREGHHLFVYPFAGRLVH
ncbi:MAG: helicase-related protein, partial [Planctomycetota bacterium]